MIRKILLSFLLFSAQLQAGDLIIGTYNVESGADTYPHVVGQAIRDLKGVDVLAIQELSSEIDLKDYTASAAASYPERASFRYFKSESGENTAPDRHNDFLALIYNSSKLRLLEKIELDSIRSTAGDSPLGKSNWRLRAALIARFQDVESGVEFYVGNVHLKCCGGEGKKIRAHQAKMLNAWISRADAPVILIGDFNIPVEPISANGNRESLAFKELEKTMQWIRPTNPVKTQCSPKYNSMLDHVFLKGELILKSVSVQFPESAYCENDAKGGADHRPIIAVFGTDK